MKYRGAVLTRDDCENAMAAHGMTVANEFLCTGPLTGGMGVCTGDAGGPVLNGNTLVGVISYTTTPCAQVNSAGVHMDIFQVIDWVNRIINFN